MKVERADAELVVEVRHGAQWAFEELMRRYSGKVFSLASRLTRNSEDAEEVLQDVFATVFRKLGEFQGKSTFSSWLYRVTVNSCLMKLRKRRQDKSVPIDEVIPDYQDSALFRTDEMLQADEITHRQRLSVAIEHAIAKLPADYRPVFVLRDIDGLTSRQVSKMLKLSIPAVKSRLHRSRLLLRRRLLPIFRELESIAGRSVDAVSERPAA